MFFTGGLEYCAISAEYILYKYQIYVSVKVFYHVVEDLHQYVRSREYLAYYI